MYGFNCGHYFRCQCTGCFDLQLFSGSFGSRCAERACGGVTIQETGLLCKKSESRSAQELMLSNPDMMMNMMKGQVTGFLPQVCP